MAVPRVKDLTTGSIGKTLVAFALPFFFSSLLQNIYNLVDATIAGNIYGEGALAAIGTTASIYVLIIMFANGLNSGFGIVLSRAFGSHDEGKLRRAASAMTVLNGAIHILLAIVLCVLVEPILRLLNTPSDIFDQAKSYIFIIFAGLPVTGVYNMQSGMLRSLGNSRTPLFFLAIASCLNVALDLMFVAVLDWGVAGIALATVIAQFVSCILCQVHIHRHYPELQPSRDTLRFDRALYAEMLSTGISMSLMMSIFNLGTVCLQSAINSLGTYTITAYTAGRKLYEFMNMPQSAMATALTTVVSQNYGAGKIDRCRKSHSCEIKICLCTSLVMILVANLAGPFLLQAVSGSSEPEVLKNGMLYLRIETAGLPVLVVLMATRMFMQGVGSKIIPILSSLIELIIKIVFTFLVIPRLGFLGVCLVEPLLWLICMLFLLVGFMRINRRLKEGAQTI